MAFTFEDGTGVTDANAYITVAFANTYHTDRNHTDWTGTTAKLQSAIVRASMYVDSRFGRKFRGFRQRKDQGLEWPRLSALDDDGYLLDGVPRQLERAVAEYALRALQFGELAPDVPPSVPRQSHSDGSGGLQDPTSVQTGEVEKVTSQVGPILTSTTFRSTRDSTAAPSAARSAQSTLIDGANIPQYPAADLWIEELLKSQSSRSLRRG